MKVTLKNADPKLAIDYKKFHKYSKFRQSKWKYVYYLSLLINGTILVLFLIGKLTTV